MTFAITIFSSAFLLFQVQPIIAKFILPWYGGSPAVWSTCMLFFQVGLLIGYVYAHLLACYVKARDQFFLHAGLLILSLTFLPITPDDALKPDGGGDPILEIIWLLILTVGTPYILISSTGPLLQHWFNRRYADRSPYRLYALSNLGSLLGLLTYPFLIEPTVALGSQANFWSVGYLLFVGTCIWSGSSLFNENTTIRSQPDDRKKPVNTMNKLDPLIWVGLATCGSIMLLAVTSKITQEFFVVPFLWVLPLSLYLCTFIIAFDSPKWYRRGVWIPAFLLAVGVITYLLQPGTRLPIKMTIPLYCAAMFCIVMVCHGEIARSKPPARQLTFFYLMVSLGGVLGGLLVTFVATNVFAAFWELHVGVVSAVILIGVSLFRFRDEQSERVRSLIKWSWSVSTLVLIVFMVNSIVEAEGDALTTRRNFHGVFRVYEKEKGERDHHRKLYNGQINQGMQLLHPDKKDRIVSYFSAHSGIGIAFRRHPKRLARTDSRQTDSQDLNLNVGVVGLGVGVVASWGLPGDVFRFYEINPEVVTIASDYFTLLKDSKAEVEVIVGDGRISLERELREQGSMQFDLLVVDAFAGNSIPTHLVTKEAFKLYKKHLRDDGILALLISNRYLDLRPVIYKLAKVLDIPAIMIHKKRRSKDYIKGSRWVLLTNNKGFLLNPSVLKYITPWPSNIRSDIIWTDDYQSLYNVQR